MNESTTSLELERYIVAQSSAYIQLVPWESSMKMSNDFCLSSGTLKMPNYKNSPFIDKEETDQQIMQLYPDKYNLA